MTAWPTSESATLPSSMSSANLLRVQLYPITQITDEVLNRTGLCINLWGTLLITGLQLDFVVLTTTLLAQPFNNMLKQ